MEEMTTVRVSVNYDQATSVDVHGVPDKYFDIIVKGNNLSAKNLRNEGSGKFRTASMHVGQVEVTFFSIGSKDHFEEKLEASNQ